MKWVYLALAIAGLVLTSVCFGIHFSTRGAAAWPEFWGAPFASWAISGFTWDLLLVATVAMVWMRRESQRLGVPGFWIYFVLTFAVGICFAFPLFLYRRENALACTTDNREQIDAPK